jgi:hypothetical protein
MPSSGNEIEQVIQLLSIDEDMQKICKRYSRQLINRERLARSLVRPTSEASVPATIEPIPAPTRFARKRKDMNTNQKARLNLQHVHFDEQVPVMKVDAPNHLEQLESDPDSVQTYTTTRDLNSRTPLTSRITKDV